MTARPVARLVLRGLAWALAIVALLSPFAGSADLFSALMGVVVGLTLGELALRQGVRSRWILLVAIVACLLGPVVAGLLTDTFVARILGPGLALSLAGWAVFGVVASSFVGAFRALGARHDAARGLEAVLLGACGASVFASHRDGAVGRPLAVADLAWTLGMDPRTLLFAIGGAAALVLLALLAVEHTGRIRRSALLIVPVVLALGWLLVGVAGVTPPPPPLSVSSTKPEDGDLPRAAPSKPPVDVPPQAGDKGDEPSTPDGTDGAKPSKPEGTDGAKPSKPEGTDGSEPSKPAGADPSATAKPEGTSGSKPSKPESADGAADAAPDDDGGQAPGAAPKPDGRAPPQGAAAPPKPADGKDEGTPDAAQPESTPPQSPNKPQDGKPSQMPRSSAGDGTPQDAPPPPDEESKASGAGKNAQPVAVVLLDDDFEPATELWYLRQGALSVFNGHRLIPASPDSGLDLDLIGAMPTAPIGSAAPPPMDVRFQLTGSVAILVDHPLPFAPDFPVSYAPLPNPDPSRFLRAWSFSSAVNPLGFEGMLGHTSNGPDVTPELRQTYLEAPTDPRYRKLADEIVADLSASAATDPLARALAVKRWLDDHMIGDSSRRHEGEGDPTADFLFGDLHGYCVHGAHASVYLDRLLGVPARIGTGYAVPASDRRGSTLVVRGHQAHAWPEIWLDGIGWVAVDPTPREIVDPPSPPLDEDVARQLGELARQTPPAADVPPTPSDWFRQVMPWLRSIGSTLWALLRGALVLGLIGVYAAKVWFALCPWFFSASLPRLAYRSALHRLTSLGLGREVGESREHHARRVASVAPSMAALTDAHVEAAFGPGGSSVLDASAWRALVRAVRRESAATVPWWRRALGWIDPSTPFRTR